MTMKVDDILKATSGRLAAAGAESFVGITTDTRKKNDGLLFFALKGENYDAHDFLEKAVDSGAKGLVVHEWDSQSKPLKPELSQKIKSQNVSVILVSDTLKALQSWSADWRHKFRVKVIGLTGSNGKTTTKDFATTLISSKFKTICTQGNLNNFIGLPLSLLRLDKKTDVGVFEMGLSVPGEIATLAEIADPDVVLCTSVGHAHMEGLGDINGIAKNKEHIYTHARKDAKRIFNLDNSYTKKMYERSQKTSGADSVMTFSSSDSEADVHLKEVVSTIDFLEIKGHIGGEHGQARVAIFGRHNISNLMGAAALALAVGVEPQLIWKTLPQCKGYWGRNQIVKLKSGATVLFDAYNANPDSVNALLENVSRIKLPGKLYGIFGDMLEMGEFAGEVHQAWGHKAAELSFEQVLFFGQQGEHFQQGAAAGGLRKNLVISKTYEDSLAQKVLSMLNPGDIVLVKGSRGMKLERAVMQLEPLEFSSSPKS